MKVIMAERAGFCFGVEKAMDIAKKQITDNDGSYDVYTCGPLIHNAEVIKDLKAGGVHVIENDEDIDSMETGDRSKKVVIRSHGVAKAVIDKLNEKGFEVIDATCPFVKRIHNTVMQESRKGNGIIIVGDPDHPEVRGIMGWCECEPIVVESTEDIDGIDLKEDTKYCVVAQTTFNHNKFKDIVEKLQNLRYDVTVVDTICNATYERQCESREIAKKVDTMIVIGDTHSSNSKKLYEICKDECEDTHFIQTLDDLNLENTNSVRLVGITAGASTPNYIIEEVQKHVRTDF